MPSSIAHNDQTEDRLKESESASRKMQWFSVLAICVNWTAFLMLAALIALGVYVNKNYIVLGSVATNGYIFINVDTTYWNVGCNLVGTFVGILATAAFSMQDSAVTGQELLGSRGVLALFLKPLTMKRGLDQLLRLQSPFERTILLLATATAALTSAATVAIFGIHRATFTVVNPAASYSLAALNGSFFYNDRDGSVNAAESPSTSSFISQLSGFAYKSAYITALKTSGKYNAWDLSYEGAYIPEQGMLGDSQYATLSTGGIGLNTSSYIQYSGYPNGFDLPADYVFKSLNGIVWGTNVSVDCDNVTSQYRYDDIISSDISGLHLIQATRLSGPNLTFAQFLFSNIYASFALTSSHYTDTVTGEWRLVVAVLDLRLEDPPLVFDCRYSGREYIAKVSLDSPTSPLRIDHVLGVGQSLGVTMQQRLISLSGTMIRSGIVPQGLNDGYTNAFAGGGGGILNWNDEGKLSWLENVLCTISEAEIALMRQSVERTNAYNPSIHSGTGIVNLSIDVSRLGGRQYAWLTVLGILLFSVSLGTVRQCLKSTVVGFEAQDAVDLLGKTLNDESVTALSRFRYTKEGGLTRSSP